jgi:SAM-dependent methyltransferase
MASLLQRYDRFGWDYELISPLSDREASWYLKHAEKTGGPVLELACGSGRLLCRLAEAGFDVHGIDLSSTMLKIAQAHRDKLAPEARNCIRLHQMDMADFDLRSRMGAVIIADNSLRELETEERMLACLKRCRAHLRPGGRLMVSENLFDPSRFKKGVRRLRWSDPLTHPDSGLQIRRKVGIKYLEDEKVVEGVFFYKIIEPDGAETMEECPFKAPVLSIKDYESLFRKSGFTPEVFSDFQDKPYRGAGKVLCFVCKRAV